MDSTASLRISALWRALELARLRQPGLTLTELRTLLAVERDEGLSVASVARVCGFTSATASRTLRGLAPADMPGALNPARGLVHLVRGPADDRSRFAFLTPSGRGFCGELEKAFVAKEAQK